MASLKPHAKPKKNGSPDYPHPLGHTHWRALMHILDAKGNAYCSGESLAKVKELKGTRAVCFECRKIVEALPKAKKKD